MTRPWARVLLGVVCAVVGAVLTLMPFASLDALVWLVAGAFFATGVSELSASRNRREPRRPVPQPALGYLSPDRSLSTIDASRIRTPVQPAAGRS